MFFCLLFFSPLFPDYSSVFLEFHFLPSLGLSLSCELPELCRLFSWSSSLLSEPICLALSLRNELHSWDWYPWEMNLKKRFMWRGMSNIKRAIFNALVHFPNVLQQPAAQNSMWSPIWVTRGSCSWTIFHFLLWLHSRDLDWKQSNPDLSWCSGVECSWSVFISSLLSCILCVWLTP